MNDNKQDKILALRNQGYSYNKIAKEIGCSKSLVRYYCGGDKAKEQNRRRRNKYGKNNPISIKLYRFLNKKNCFATYINSKIEIIRKLLFWKIKSFSRINRKSGKMEFKAQDLLDKIGSNPKCYLTGRPIDLSKSRTYELDHIIPSSRGGDNSIDNCGLACRDANRAKADMTLEEFKALCNDVINNLK